MLLRLNETLKYVSLLGDTFPHGIYGVYTLPLSLGIQTIVQIIIVKINIDLATTDCIWVILRHYLPVDPSLHLYNSFSLGETPCSPHPKKDYCKYNWNKWNKFFGTNFSLEQILTVL